MSDVYSTPQSELNRNSEYSDSTDDFVVGNSEFKVFDVLGEAWEKTNGVKGSIWLGMLLYILVAIGISVAFLVIGTLLNKVDSPALAAIEQIVVTIVGTPMLLGIFMIGLKRSVNAPKSGTMVFNYFHRLLPIILTCIMLYVLLIVGFLLLIIPGIYLSVAYYYGTALVVEKGMSPWQALETSRKAITKRWFAFFGLIILTFLINLLGAAALLIGLVWTVPMTTMAFSIVYRNMFGVESINRQ